MWHSYAEREVLAAKWLRARGMPQGAAKAALLVARLAILGVLVFTVSWAVLLLVAVAVSVWMIANDKGDVDDRPRFRDGHAGVGLYDKNNRRIDMGDPYEQ